MADKIVIVGAGIGGLSAAIHLAASGREVIILEQNVAVGGKMRRIEEGGFTWDTGPSVITMRHVFEQLFATAGRRMEEYLTLLPVDPLTRYFYPDGVVFDALRDLSATASQIEKIEPRDVEGYLEFLAYAAKLHRITGPTFIYDQPPDLRTLARVSPFQLLEVDPWLTMDQAIRRRVRSTHLRQFLGRFATYVGASPYLAPATLSVIAHVELTGGVWYPQGGIYEIARALARLAEELGVEIRTEAGVQQVMAHNSRASGVRLTSGEVIGAEAVIANVDVTSVYQHLLPAEIATPSRRRARRRLETSCSGYVMLLGVEGEHPALAHHNIFFSRDYQREFHDVFDAGRPPMDPTVYVAITAKRDRDHAPVGCENWFVLVNAPAAGPGFDWHAEEAAYRDRVFATLAENGFDVRNRIQSEVRLTPVDIARMTGAWRGALYGVSSNQALNALRRPHNRCPHLGRLYFAGGTTHPGGGVPMVILSGKVAAQMALTDLA
jgi:diapolycopene oxygenase